MRQKIKNIFILTITCIVWMFEKSLVGLCEK